MYFHQTSTVHNIVDPGSCAPWIIRTFCLIRTNVCFPIDFVDVWIIHTFCLIRTISSRIFVQIIRVPLYHNNLKQ